MALITNSFYRQPVEGQRAIAAHLAMFLVGAGDDGIPVANDLEVVEPGEARLDRIGDRALIA